MANLTIPENIPKDKAVYGVTFSYKAIAELYNKEVEQHPETDNHNMDLTPMDVVEMVTAYTADLAYRARIGLSSERKWSLVDIVDDKKERDGSVICIGFCSTWDPDKLALTKDMPDPNAVESLCAEARRLGTWKEGPRWF